LSAKSGTQRLPMRSCVICGNKTTKNGLLRLVASPQGSVDVDSSGKLPGRGAYICADGACSHLSLRKTRLDNALRRTLSDEEWAKVATAISNAVAQA
jgi:predicted RNA-binding protein YlxR (DUF448 family)